MKPLIFAPIFLGILSPFNSGLEAQVKSYEFNEVYLNFIKKIIKQKKIEVIYSTIDKENDIFYLIFNEKCKKSKEISEVLIKHDIKSCIKVK